uniref:PHD and RING finger domain-containing protein 1 n=1 Tax=Cuerna arida TaxID=1464854 RepID=A0A1B6G3N1_9HEMI
MFRGRRRRVFSSSDSSDDEGSRHKRPTRSMAFAKKNVDSMNNLLPINSRKRQVKRQEDSDSSSDSSVIQPRKQLRRLPLIHSEDSSNSGHEENPTLLNPPVVEKISGNGNSTAGTSGLSTHSIFGATNHSIDNATSSIQRMDILDSPNNLSVNSQKVLERQSSNSNFDISPRKWRKKQAIVTSDDDSVSSEEILHRARRGALRALSDYESGDNQDRGHRVNVIRTRTVSESSSDNDIVRTRLGNRRKNQIGPTVTSDSSDSGMPVGFCRARKRRRICSSEDSDSSLPGRRSRFTQVSNSTQSETSRITRSAGSRVTVNAPNRRTRLSTGFVNYINRRSSVPTPLNDHDRAINNPINLYQIRTRSAVHSVNERNRRDRAAVSINETNRRAQGPNRERTTPNVMNWRDRRDGGREMSDTSRTNIVRRSRRVRLRRTLNYTSNTQNVTNLHPPIDISSNFPLVYPDSQNGDSDVMFTHNDWDETFVDMLLSSISSSDSNDSFPVSRPIRLSRRRNIPVLQDSDEESLPTTQNRDVDPADDNNVPKIEVFAPTKVPEVCSTSDSDGESEKCPICLTHFKLQEVGNPAACDHSFCTPCIQEWAKSNNTCPVDRRLFQSIVVRTHLQGKVIREIPVETPPPVSDIWENLIWGTVTLNNSVNGIIVTSSESDYYYDSDGDGPMEMCVVCRQTDDSDAMILCDFCMRVFHMACVNPPLQYVPVTDWYCPRCMLSGVVSESD